MRNIIVFSMITLDGVMQAPAVPRKMHQADSNMAAGLRLMVTKFTAR